MDDQYDIDNGSSPYLLQMDECIQIIDEIEADKKGTNDEKHLNMTEKYKFALYYMDMLENIQKYSYLSKDYSEVSKEKEKKSVIELRLTQKDLKEHLDL